jgi:hypothetical protein
MQLAGTRALSVRKFPFLEVSPTSYSPVEILTEMLIDPTGSPHPHLRWTAAKVLAAAVDPRLPARLLMRRFFDEGASGELAEISLIAREANLVSAIPALVRALKDEDENRRYAAAYALGMGGTRAVKALAQVVSDNTQPPAFRGMAAESLDFTHTKIA